MECLASVQTRGAACSLLHQSSHFSSCRASLLYMKAAAPPLAVLKQQISSRAQEAIKSQQPDKNQKKAKGLDIVEFLRGKNFLITGGSGLLAKALVEKILRVQPDVGQIFLLLRPKKGDSSEARLHEFIKSELFRNLQENYGEAYERFIKSKLTVIMGDITLHNLGIPHDTMRKIESQIHVIVNSAASTTFNERYDKALLTNTRGAQNVIEFSKLLSSLELVMHVSTAYVNGQKEGIVLETPLTLEEVVPIACRKRVPNANVYIEQEEEMSSQKNLALHLKDLGMERATKCGSYNTYVFTKALGEVLINEIRDDIPIVIIRPSIIGSTIVDPFGGWIEGCRMMDPIITLYAKGQIHGFVGAYSTIVDMIPLDMVVNTMLAIITKNARISGLEVYHATSSSTNSILYGDIMKFSFNHFSEIPYIDRYGKTIKLHPFAFHSDVTHFLDAECEQRKHESEVSVQMKKKFLDYIWGFATIYKPYAFMENCTFDCSKSKEVYRELSYKEKEIFNFDVEGINWEHFIKNIHIPGLRKHILNNRTNTM